MGEFDFKFCRFIGFYMIKIWRFVYEQSDCYCKSEGGVGKTTTSINLSACLAEKGKKVLLIDMDSQGNTTSGFGFEKNELDKTVYEVLREEVSIEEAIIPVEECFENLFLIPANRNLAGAEIELVTRENMQHILKKQLEPIKDEYDFIVIDCPPALGMLTVNAMTAADSVLVPIQCEFYALDGLSQLIYTIELIQESLNPDLYIEGVVFTMYDARTNLSLQVVENVKDNLKQTIYKTIIQEMLDWQKLLVMVYQLIFMIKDLLGQKHIEC